ncbi:MAG TPA: glycosyltransferase family 4 protein [Methylomusa anaerophila]|uniref:D-inositol 3-phosphate glycosyltransferase n=2 Tax=Methylomusa anaerophila TaxID=1930071 RepID=A0A348AKQ8_9FIRM|nr:glycosyltransferase family 4 protein [Methylomusa anaerophila]BBB91656.1 D-inositol 3-phosphate glycosyltransferase [Methylomusa anaerophila]HML88610.1 glycosyltransferase family 4 protein [Methylomusa anaerophila]
MNILFLHPNFPAQFLNLASTMGADPQHNVVFITAREKDEIPGVRKVLFGPSRPCSKNTHYYIHSLESAVLQGQSVYRTAAGLKEEGFAPDVIFGHSGWGSTLFMKDLFPRAALVGYFEWFNRAFGSDRDFHPHEQPDANEQLRLRTGNAPFLFDLYACDAGVTPTHWQHSQFPPEYREKIRVMHDGIRTASYIPKPDAKLVLPEIGLDLSAAKEIVTYVGRGMEPYRGFPQFMEAMDLLLRRRPRTHVVIVGADRMAYGGKKAPDGKTYKEWMLEKLALDLSRVHFTGLLPRYQYLQVLQASSVHVYLTYPFVLSWSMLEAMSAGCLLVASDTPPVREVIEDGQNGLLVDFFSPGQIADKVGEALDHPQDMKKIRARARETIVERYDFNKLLPRQLAFLQQMAESEYR